MEHVKEYAIFMLDPQGRVATWNKGAERILGYSEAEILGQPAAVLFTPEDREAAVPEQEMKKAIEKGWSEDDRWQMRKDGTRFWASGAVEPLWTTDRRLRGFAKILRDKTSEKQAADALRETERRKDEFLAVIGHELRNPLAPIQNAAQILELRGSDPATVAWARALIARQVRHLARLVDDLLDISRISRRKFRLRKGRLDLVQLVRDSVQDHRRGLEQLALTLDLSLPDRPVYVVGDGTRISQILGNLLNNAGKFTNPGGTVSVSLHGEEREAVLKVRDTGVGIDPALLPQIFDPFMQGERNLPRNPGGLGLGLALVKGLVEAHRGTVRVHSGGVGKGAEFTIRLPLEPEPAQ
jgi:PAS domain S-box-containing protein